TERWLFKGELGCITKASREPPILDVIRPTSVINLQYTDALLMAQGIRIQFPYAMQDTLEESKYIFHSFTCPDDVIRTASEMQISFLDAMHGMLEESKYIFNSFTCPDAVVVNIDSGEGIPNVYVGHVEDRPHLADVKKAPLG
ncbi:hypothetical protein Csa_023618, partial [Cucumis sativus]